MTEYVIETENLTKKYKDKTVVNNINMKVEKGKIYGLLGKNGAGKTTTMRMLLNMATKTSGKIMLFGNIPDNSTYRKIGSIIETPGFYENLTAEENLKIISKIRGNYSKENIDEILTSVSLDDNNKKYRDFSLGMKQRLGIAAAIMHNPELLILDEPINGLDPIGIKKIRHLLKRLSRENATTILISSHILSEIENLADIIGVMDNGQLITELTKDELNSQLNKSVIFEVSDPNENKSSSGLAKVWYEASIDGTVVDKGELEGTDGYFLNLSESEAEQAAKEDNLTYKKNAAITIPAGGKYESNNIRIVLHAIDNAGNETSTSTVFGIDSEGPRIVVSYDNNSVQNGKYFKANRTATVTVTERNLGTYSKKVNIKTEVGVPGSWAYSAGGSASGNADKWIKRLYYTKDGTYSMTVSGTDALGNPATVTYTGAANRSFVIDKTAPILAVYFDNNNARNGKYYNADRVATIDIRELNFRDSDVKIASKAAGPRGSGLSFPSRSGFSTSGIRRTATIPFTREGNFSFNVNYTDLAGNPATEVKIGEFVIDKTAPTVRIEDVINGGIYRNSVAPKAVFDDDNFSQSDSTFRFTGVRKIDRSELISAFRSNGEYGGVYILNDIPQIRANDDIYTAYATSTDMAGNTTTVQVVFSVNRFGSTYDYNKDKTTENLVSKQTGRFYTNKAEDLQLREINVNHIKKYTLTLDRGGNTVTLKEGKDYTVTKSESDQGTQYIYKISKSIITDEGSYNIIAKSEDEAGNINTNAAIRSEEDDSEVPVRFVYDLTKPVINVVDPGNEKVIELKKSPYYGIPALDIGIRPDDDWALGGRIKLVLRDGENEYVEEYKGKEFWEIMGENSDKKFFPEKITSGSKTKTLEVTVWDAAGNEETAHYDITVLNGVGDVARRYWYLLLLLLGAAGGGYAYYRHRRDDDDEEEGEDGAA